MNKHCCGFAVASLGLFTIAAPNAVTRGLDLSHADACCVSLREWSLDRIAAAAHGDPGAC